MGSHLPAALRAPHPGHSTAPPATKATFGKTIPASSARQGITSPTTRLRAPPAPLVAEANGQTKKASRPTLRAPTADPDDGPIWSGQPRKVTARHATQDVTPPTRWPCRSRIAVPACAANISRPWVRQTARFAAEEDIQTARPVRNASVALGAKPSKTAAPWPRHTTV